MSAFKLKLNEQIALLRKQKDLTQENLANLLGVTNQTVSKWESAQCCPDIQLLPKIAKIFNVTVDELLGYTLSSASDDIFSTLRKKIGTLPEGEDFDFALRAAAELHTSIITKYMTPEPTNKNRDTGEAIKPPEKNSYGYSCLSIPEITTTMRHGTVFFSDNKDLNLTNTNIGRIASILKPFCDVNNLKIASALYRLTVHSENLYATAAQISEKSEKPVEKVTNCLSEELASFILEKKSEKETAYRFDGMYMNILPIIALLNYK